MKASEIRIGNYVYFNGKMIKIGFFDMKNLVLSNGIIQLSPIPLTEEWLLKFGFEKFTGWDGMTFWKLKGAEHADRFELMETARGYESPSGKIIEFVHTLQNCFYFHELTGEELTLKS